MEYGPWRLGSGSSGLRHFKELHQALWRQTRTHQRLEQEIEVCHIGD